ncbi:MAG: GNAT family N-acetyltransferase [Eubacteriales bacterium]|nr:GNAT family N-acetyltransferase [Eubacteriales bacterium]
MLRIATKADVPAMLDIYGPYILHSTATFEYTVPSPAEFTARFEAVTAQYPWLVWEEDGEILGYAYASAPYARAAYAWCAEPSVYLRPRARGRGIGKKLCAVLENVLDAQGYVVMYSLICSENQASIRFHTKNGYSIRSEFPDCGFKFGRWLGLIWMEKRLKSTVFPTAPPVSWRSIVENNEIVNNILDKLSLS